MLPSTIFLVQLCCMLTVMQKSVFLILIYSLCTSLLPGAICAQSISGADISALKNREDSLKDLSVKIVMGREAADRFRSDSAFTRILVRALKTPFSFHYPFDSIQTISKLYSPDSNFRIFTWQVVRDESVHRRHGAIQINTADGTLKLFPLIDRSFLIQSPYDTVTNNEWWIGSIYYKIIKKEYEGKNYYSLLGYDENTMRSTKKRIEVLSFNDKNQPVFGGPFFSFDEDTVRRPMQSRFWIEFKKDGNARMQYDEELDMIIFDHLISESNEPAKKYTYIPDGDYEGFKWKDGRWVHINKVFNFKLKDGEAPVAIPITEDKLGNPTKQNEEKKSSTKPRGKG
jgi:hypothetical protein